MIHYIYKIIFLKGLPHGRYYIGKRSYNGKDIANDTYAGSGLFCKAYFKKYGKKLGKTYIKEIIEINDSKQSNSLREEEIINNKWIKDPLCMNQKPGGCGGSIKGNRSRVVVQYDLNLNLIKRWKSITEASKVLNISDGGIWEVCNHRRCSIGGYVWCYEEEQPIYNKKVQQNGPRKVKQFNKYGKFIKEYNSIKEAAEIYNIKWQSIQACCIRKVYHAGSYIWRFSEDDSITKDVIENVINHTKVFKIHQLDKNGNLVNTFDTIAQASKLNNFPLNGIRDGIYKGKCKYGFYWKKVEYYENKKYNRRVV